MTSPLTTPDFLVVGGGVAGLSAAAALSAHGRVLVLEAEDALGFHSSGRSATFSHFGIGNRPVRALTALSRVRFLDHDGPAPLARRAQALFVATAEMLGTLDRLERDMAAHAAIERCDAAAMAAMVPVLRFDEGGLIAGLLDRSALRLDSEAMLQAYARTVRQAGSTVVTGQRVVAIAADGTGWKVSCEGGHAYTAPILVNAAGAWADEVASLAGLPPIGLTPLRRTIIAIDPPKECPVDEWPFVKTAMDDFYMLPQSGRLLASPVDEVPSAPGDAQPEDHDVALAAAKIERYTSLTVRRIAHRWAGLRTFAADRTPVVGFDPRATGFFWLAGQGGFGLQTAPALAEGATALASGGAWPEKLAASGISPHELSPERLIHD